jgi:hypothetical protein
MAGAINHPADKPAKDKAPGAEHYMLTPKMKLAIDKAVRMVGGTKVAFVGAEPTTGPARGNKVTDGTTKKVRGKITVSLKKPSRSPEPGHRPPGPSTPGTPIEYGDDTRS